MPAACIEFHGGQRADDPNAYYNRRAECWSLMRDWLKAGAEIPDDGELEVDLCSPEYGFSSKNQVQLERKEDMKSRGLASPDLGDALAMTFGLRVGVRARVGPQNSVHLQINDLTTGSTGRGSIILVMIACRHLLGWLLSAFRSRHDLILENLALRQQLLALHAQRVANEVLTRESFVDGENQIGLQPAAVFEVTRDPREAFPPRPNGGIDNGREDRVRRRMPSLSGVHEGVAPWLD
jgi:hypothetical protein